MIRFIDNTYIHAIDACLNGSASSLNQLKTFLRFIGEVIVAEKLVFSCDKNGPVYPTTQKAIEKIKLISDGVDLFKYYEIDSETYTATCDKVETLLSEEIDYMATTGETEFNDFNPVFTGKNPHEQVHHLIMNNKSSKRISINKSFSAPISSNIAPFVILRDSIYSKISKRLQDNKWSYELTQSISIAARMLAYEQIAETLNSTYLPATGRIANHVVNFKHRETTFIKLTDNINKELYRPKNFSDLSDIVDSLIVIANGDPQKLLKEAFELRNNTHELRRRFSQTKGNFQGDAYLISATKMIAEYQNILEYLLKGNQLPSLGMSIIPGIVFPGIPILKVDIAKLKMWATFKFKSGHIKSIANLLLKAEEKRQSIAYRRLLIRCMQNSVDTESLEKQLSQKIEDSLLPVFKKANVIIYTQNIYGDKVEGDSITAEVRGNIQQVAIGKTINQNITNNEGVLSMRDTYINKGQTGAMGNKAQSANNTFQQLLILADDLSKLKDFMRNTAYSPEQKATVDEVIRAEQAARNGDESKMMNHLKNAGKWALDAAREIGTDVAAEVIKKSLGV